MKKYHFFNIEYSNFDIQIAINDLDNKINICYLKIKDINETLEFINEFSRLR